MQTEATMRAHLAPVEVALMVNQQTTRAGEDGRTWRKGGPRALPVGPPTGTATVGNSPGVLDTLKRELPRDPAFPGVYLTKSQTLIQEDLRTLRSRSVIYSS